jgi:thioredoxin reductase (NADPH)
VLSTAARSAPKWNTRFIHARIVIGQAGTSAKIRNYLGFRCVISGSDLAAEASRQTEQLGAEFVVSRTAAALASDGHDHLVTLSSGDVAQSGAVIVTGGVAYGSSGLRRSTAWWVEGSSTSAGSSEVAAMRGRRVWVPGARNSAGQAACALAAAGAHVTVLVRGEALGASMSDSSDSSSSR